MATTVTAVIRQVLADGDWHTLDELVTAAGHLIAPGRAYRSGEDQRRKAHGSAPGGRARGDNQTAIDAGRRRQVRDLTRQLVRSGHAERDAGRYRLVKR